ncbi:hypothetical protein FO488_16005 [Geobacter sp. FeAm09]|uniref:hypothetical protein n=1 Tax=Geobacter sp. FeAm09 TaxID=2597769 RepID=UPI0011EFE394|nr:hypothetical protein [Geobacter sp. FeAm09]QEM69512.1 hypothetical protein FO488_16005 [Geobacter sp. FeAm09]
MKRVILIVLASLAVCGCATVSPSPVCAPWAEVKARAAQGLSVKEAIDMLPPGDYTPHDSPVPLGVLMSRLDSAAYDSYDKRKSSDHSIYPFDTFGWIVQPDRDAWPANPNARSCGYAYLHIDYKGRIHDVSCSTVYPCGPRPAGNWTNRLPLVYHNPGPSFLWEKGEK